MKIKAGMTKDYEHFVQINSTDPYSNGVVTFMKRWAKLMEERIANGERVRDIAEETSHEADTEGITGFMYGAAVASLAKFWKYGEELRKWHNKEYDYEGEGTINPAVLTIK